MKNIHMARDTDSIKVAMRVIDDNGMGIAFVYDKYKKLIGVVTDGDIRRAILNGIDIEHTSVETIMTKNILRIKEGVTDESILDSIRTSPILSKIPSHAVIKVPIVNDKEELIDIKFVVNDLGSKYNFIKKNVRNVLVIGGAGYLGSVLCRKFLERGYYVRVLDSLLYGDAGISELYNNKNFDFIYGDIRDLQIVTDALIGIDSVVHLAALSSDSASDINPPKSAEINYLSTKLVGEVCKYNQINRFLFASSCSTYGASKTPNDLLTEDSELSPVSLYGRTKLQSEEALLSISDDNFRPTIFRMGTIYGYSPRMRLDLIVNKLIAKALIDHKLELHGGNQWRPNIHIADVCDAYIKCLEAPIDIVANKIFNLGSNEQNYQIKTIEKIVVKEVNKYIDLEVVDGIPMDDSRNYKGEFSKIENMLGFKASHTIADAVISIKSAIDKKLITNYNNPIYDNGKYLKR